MCSGNTGREKLGHWGALLGHVHLLNAVAVRMLVYLADHTSRGIVEGCSEGGC